MAVYTKPGAEVFAPQDNAGNPRSVSNGDAQVWATEVERRLALADQGYSANYETRAQLYADLAHPAGSLGRVFDDSNSSLNGIYKKSGASGAGSWTRIGPLAGGGALAAKDSVASEDLDDEAVTNAKLDSMAQGTVKMRRADAGDGAPTNTALADLKTDLALSKSDVGLSNADNTSDANKPISIASDEVFAPLTLAGGLIYIGTDYDLYKIDPAGEIIQGTDKSTGLPLVGGGGGGGGSDKPDLSLITVQRSTDALRIHVPQVDDSYVRWAFNHVTNVGQRSDVWQIQGISEATLSGGVSTQVRRICDAGQVEFAASLSSAPGSFVIGGNAHGRDEMLEDPTLLIDGVGVPINGGAATFTGRRIEIHQASQLLDPGDLSNLAKRYTRWAWEDGWFYLRNHLVFEKELEFGTLYMAMLPMLQLDGAVEITHSGLRSPLYHPVEDYTGASSTYTDAGHVKLWGDRYSGEVEALSGWEGADRESHIIYLGPSTNRNKIYFAPLGVANARTPAIGSVLTMESRMRVAVNQSNS